MLEATVLVNERGSRCRIITLFQGDCSRVSLRHMMLIRPHAFFFRYNTDSRGPGVKYMMMNQRKSSKETSFYDFKSMGLTSSAAEMSRREHGTNVLTPPQRESLWLKFLEKFQDPIIIILLIAMVLSFGVSCYEYWGQGEK